MSQPINIAGVVLCGGRSSRMGSPKAWLPFGDETMLQRVVRIVAEVASPIVVVAAAGQDLPALPAVVVVVRDRRPDSGPLEGIAVGLEALSRINPTPEAAFVTACDAPLLRPALIRLLAESLGESEAVVPWIDERLHPLAAIYRLSMLRTIEAALAADRPRLIDLFDARGARRLSREVFVKVDPELESLMNLNHPEEYHDALRRAGLAISRA